MSIEGTKLTLNDLTILGLLLERETGVTGLELEKTIDNRNMRVWTKIGKSSIYFGLKKLEKNNFVSSEAKYYRKNQSKPPVKEKYYKITHEGKNEIEKAIFNILSTHKKTVDPFDIALSFSNWLSPKRKKNAFDLRLKMIKDRKELLQIKFEEFNKPGAYGLDIEGRKDFNSLVLKNILIIFSRPLSLVEAEEKWILNNIDDIIQ